MVINRIGTSFHESFPLSRTAISQLLDVIANYEAGSQGLSRFALLRKETNLGTNYVKAMPRYARGAGLLDSSLQSTQLGRLFLRKDPLLEQPATQWIMHYHLSAPHGPGPAFWHHVVVNRFRSGNDFSRDDIRFQIDTFIKNSEGKSLSKRSIEGAAQAFLGTYLKDTGLGRLRILEAVGDGYYRVLEPETPPVWVLAYAILDFWAAQYSQQITVSLNDLAGPEGVASLFLAGAGRLNAVLRTMQEEGYVEVHRVAPPYQVVLLKPDRISLLAKLYSHDH